MVHFIAPVVILITKKMVVHKVSEAILDGITEASVSVDRQITRHLVSSLMNMSINIALLLSAIYLSPSFLHASSAVYLICSVYLASVIYTFYTGVTHIPLIFRFLFRYRLNLKAYIKDQIYQEAHIRAVAVIQNRNIPVRILNRLFGRSASQIAASISIHATRIIFRKVISFVMIIVMVTISYVLIFRFIVAPTLIQDATGFNFFQAALFPIASSVDYFFDTKYIAWIQ